MKHTSVIFLLILVLGPFIGKSQTSVKEMVESKRFVFEAQSMSPLKGSMRTLAPLVIH